MQIALPTTARVLFALVMREMTTRFGRSSLGYFWALAEPVGFIGLLSLVFSQIVHHPPVGESFPLFYASGYLAFHMANDMSQITGRAVQVNRPLLAYPAVTPLDTVLARALLQGLTGFAVTVTIIGGLLLAFPEPVRIDPVSLGLSVAMGGLLGLGIGLVNVTLFALVGSWAMIWGIVSRPLFLVSCVFFTFGSLPMEVQAVLWWNPYVHLVGLMRAGIYPTYDPAYVSVTYLAALSMGLIVLGLLMMRRFRHRLVET